MSAQKTETTSARGRPQGRPHRAWEALLFLLASAVGVYGVGQGLAGFYEQGQQISLIWLAATGIAFFVLFAQMGRVHDTWPRRPGKAAPTSPSGETALTDEPLEGEPRDGDGK